ncbi:MAG: RNA methyltransferase [Myxococcota bacterium]
MTRRLDLALVHHPVVNRKGELIASTVDEMDVFDACRLSLIYPVRFLWLVTPVPAQRALVDRLLVHGRDPARTSEGRPRFEAVAGVASLDDAVDEAEAALGRRPTTVATSAQPPTTRPALRFDDARARMDAGEPMMLLVGKAWGLAPSVLREADAQLEPLRGGTGFDHFPVRGAIAVLLDRLLAPPSAAP